MEIFRELISSVRGGFDEQGLLQIALKYEAHDDFSDIEVDCRIMPYIYPVFVALDHCKREGID